MWRDIRLAARLLVKDRTFSLTAITALALGIAANATVFGLFNGIFLRSLPFEAPGRMVVLNSRIESNPNSNFPISYLELQDWRAAAHRFDGLAGFTQLTMNVAGDDRQPERLLGAFLSANSFSLVGVRPALGRDFRAEDDRPGAAPVVMLSQAMWRRRYGADPSVVGRQIRVNGVVSTVIGVMPEGFGFPNNEALWQPLAALPRETRDDRENRSLLVLGRMKAGVTLERALADVQASATRPDGAADPARNVVPKIRLFRDFFIGPDNRIGFVLMLAAVGCVLLIACANVANLLLARGAERAREITVRMSIGASRGRIVRQLLFESVLLSGAATAVGLALSLAGIRMFEGAIANTGAPYWFDFGLDLRVFAYLAAVCVGAALLFGLMPALRTTRTTLTDVLGQGGKGSSTVHSRRWAGGLVIGQLALTLTLLMTAGLSLRELAALREMPIGIDTAGVTVLKLDLGRPQTDTEDPVMTAFYRGLDERLAAIPGLRVTYASEAPHGGASSRDLGIAVRDTAEGTPRRPISHLLIGPNYFEVMAAGPVRGRTFTAADRSGVAVINERLAVVYFPNENPIGRQIRLEALRQVNASEWLTIVGVAPNIRQQSTGAQEFDPLVYMPYAGHPLPFATLLVRSPLDIGAVALRLRAELRALDPDLPLFDVRTLDAAVAFSHWPTGVFGALFGTFAGMALLLAAVGLYGVTAYSVSQRTREIGIRTALGAQARQIWWTVARRSSTQIAIGLLLGTFGAFGSGQLVQGLLVAVTGADLLTFAGVAGLLTLVAAAACLIPARRAVRLNPVEALRAE